MDHEPFIRVSIYPELIKEYSTEQKRSILEICIEKYRQNKKKDDNKIFPILLQLVDLGSYPEAEYYLSLLCINKQGILDGEISQNFEYAKQFNIWLQQAAEKGHAKAKE
ncbi:24602_t:CDS:1, partial [Gigaspora margarita]